MTQGRTFLSGTFTMDKKGADTHGAVLSWPYHNHNEASLPAILYPYTFQCEIHVHLRDSMNCPCVCIDYLIEHYRTTNFEVTFQHLPSHVQIELNADTQFCQKLFHPVFNTANGIRIITERTTNNPELLVGVQKHNKN